MYPIVYSVYITINIYLLPSIKNHRRLYWKRASSGSLRIAKVQNCLYSEKIDVDGNYKQNVAKLDIYHSAF